MEHVGDITKLNGAELPVVDVITGGSPCQDLSIAGARAGLAGERSGLFMEQIRVVKEMRDADRRTGRTGWNVRPRYMVWENVPGAFSSNGGKDFQAVLTEIVRIVEPSAADVPLPDKGKWPKSGSVMGYGADGCPFSICYRVHDAQFWGVPQRRKRIALVADFGGFSASEILFERKGMRGDTPQGGEERQGSSAGAGAGASGAISFQERSGKPGGGKGILIQEEHTGAACDNPDSNHGGVAIIENHPNDSRVKIREDGVFQALSGRMGTGGGNVPMVMEPVCIGNGQADQLGVSDKVGALNCMHDQQAVMTYGLDRASYNQGYNASFSFTVLEDAAPTQTSMGPGAVSTNVVRRLTPKECERLQGFPDNWTDIGAWTDSKGKLHKESSDASRYKALGNSIAIPFWFYLLRRIAAQYERPATLGSLFDGIGGFPLCWERCNGPGTALWASEIEEFPIAVTKYHFGGNDDNPDRGR